MLCWPDGAAAAAGAAARRARAACRSSACWRRRGTSWARAATATPWRRASPRSPPDTPSWRASAARARAPARSPPRRLRPPRPRSDRCVCVYVCLRSNGSTGLRPNCILHLLSLLLIFN